MKGLGEFSHASSHLLGLPVSFSYSTLLIAGEMSDINQRGLMSFQTFEASEAHDVCEDFRIFIDWHYKLSRSLIGFSLRLVVIQTATDTFWP